LKSKEFLWWDVLSFQQMLTWSLLMWCCLSSVGNLCKQTPVFLKTLYTSKGFELADCTV
jgi:hypothetical protein